MNRISTIPYDQPSISISSDTTYHVSIQQYDTSVPETILITESLTHAKQALLTEAPFNYHVSIHDQTDTLLLLYQDCKPVYRHDIMTQP